MREAPLPAAEAKKRYLIYLAVRLTGLAVMAAGVWLVREVGQAPGLAVVYALVVDEHCIVLHLLLLNKNKRPQGHGAVRH